MESLITIVLIALTIIGEARGQPIEGQMCVAHTIRNRMLLTGRTAEEVTFEPGQYMLWEPDVMAPRYVLPMLFLQCRARGAFPYDPWCMEPFLIIGDEAYWWEILSIAAAVHWGQQPPPGCEGVVNFENPAFWPENDGLPPWADMYEFAVCYGDHCFWRPKQ